MKVLIVFSLISCFSIQARPTTTPANHGHGYVVPGNLLVPEPDNGCKNGKAFNGKCYFLQTKRVSFDDAIQSCANKGGHLAYIEDEATYQAMTTFLRKEVTRLNVAKGSFWTGLLFYKETSTTPAMTKTLNGRTITWDMVWYPRFPMSHYKGWDGVAIHVKRLDTDPKQGFFNHPRGSRMRPLCEKKMIQT